ncbi:MAG: hypothetical protein ACK5JS_00190 [Mangrovibacterium sp.]
MHEDIKEFLWQRSRTSLSMERLSAIVLETPFFISDLLDVCTNVEDSEGNWRSAWLMYKVADENPILLQAYAPRLISFFISKYPQCSDGLLRGLLRIIAAVEYSEDLCGELLDACAQIYKKQKYAKAVRVNAMNIIGNIVCRYPELKAEFEPEFDLLATYDEKSVAAAARNQLKRLRRI